MSVIRKYIFQFGGRAPFKGYAVFSCLLASFYSNYGSVYGEHDENAKFFLQKIFSVQKTAHLYSVGNPAEYKCAVRIFFKEDFSDIEDILKND